MLVTCLNCSKEFEKSLSEINRTKNNFCSRSCAASFNNKGKQKNPKKLRVCKKCNSEYFYKRKSNTLTFCDKCFQENKNSNISEQLKLLTIGQYRNKISLKDKHPSWISANIRRFNRSWNKELTKIPCQKCGYDKHVELCHIKPISDFDDKAILSDVNSPDNILVLCPRCHWEFDNSLLELKNIPKRS